MKKIILVLLLAFNFGLAINAYSQVFDSPPRDGAWDKTHTNNRKAIAYTPVREADVSWYTKVWRIIDFREKMNQPFYYPDEAIRDRVSFMQMVMNGIKEGTITMYDNDEFTKPISYEQMIASYERMDTTQIEDPDNGEVRDTVYKRTLNLNDIKQVKIKEVWFFDKQRSVMDVRILGFCPLKQDYTESGELKPGFISMFWVYFPDTRPLFAKTEVFNPKNGAERRSYDDIFMKRYFQSYITKEDNTYDRTISAYKTGLDALLEAEAVKEKIFTIEHDIWEF